MPTNEPLEDRIAWTYPNEYRADTWVENLLPRYIEEQLDQHHKTIEQYKEHVATWQQKDPSVSVPESPLPPAMLLQACDVYAKHSGFRYEILASSLFAMEKRARRFKAERDFARKERDHYEQLWNESEENQAPIQLNEPRDLVN